MAILKPSDLRQQAKQMLGATNDNPKKLVLLHTMIALGGSLLITLMNYVISHQIAGTGGLSGMGVRSVLSTIQSILELTVMVALPFWEIGLLFAALQWSKGQNSGFQGLLQGFRRFGSVLSLRLLQGLLFFALAIAVVQLSSIIFLLTPASKRLVEILESVVGAETPQQMESLITPQLITDTVNASIPLLFIALVLFALIAIPVFYRLRFTEFAVMEGNGARKAILHSIRTTHYHCLQLAKLDLSFWWFYLLQILCLCISYGDAILKGIGVTLPISEDASFFLFYVLGGVCQALLLWRYQATVLTTYCVVYNTLGEAHNASPKSVSNNLPWDI